MTERRVVSETGGEKGQKLERYDLIPVVPLRLVAEHYGIGASKYVDRNWQRGYNWSLSYAALMRHLQAFWGGETLDKETNSFHLAAVVFHALALLEFQVRPELYSRFDDREQHFLASVSRPEQTTGEYDKNGNSYRSQLNEGGAGQMTSPVPPSKIS